MKPAIVFALLTAFFWGNYGPALGLSRSGLASPFKPYVMIGIAYLVWGVFGGTIGMAYKGDSFALESFMGKGGFWGFTAGSLGAFGALTLTLAMFSGGTAMPHVVMPIVFGGAVTVTALVSVWQTKMDNTSPWLWAGIAAILLGVIVTAYNTPHAKPPLKPSPPVTTPE